MTIKLKQHFSKIVLFNLIQSCKNYLFNKRQSWKLSVLFNLIQNMSFYQRKSTFGKKIALIWDNHVKDGFNLIQSCFLGFYLIWYKICWNQVNKKANIKKYNRVRNYRFNTRQSCKKFVLISDKKACLIWDTPYDILLDAFHPQIF